MLELTMEEKNWPGKDQEKTYIDIEQKISLAIKLWETILIFMF